MQIQISRNNGWYGRVRALKIIVDGQMISSIKSGETLSLEIPSGAQQIWGKMDWGKTNVVDLNSLPKGASLHFRAWLTLNPLRNLAIIQIPVELEIQ